MEGCCRHSVRAMPAEHAGDVERRNHANGASAAVVHHERVGLAAFDHATRDVGQALGTADGQGVVGREISRTQRFGTIEHAQHPGVRDHAPWLRLRSGPEDDHGVDALPGHALGYVDEARVAAADYGEGAHGVGDGRVGHARGEGAAVGRGSVFQATNLRLGDCGSIRDRPHAGHGGSARRPRNPAVRIPWFARMAAAATYG